MIESYALVSVKMTLKLEQDLTVAEADWIYRYLRDKGRANWPRIKEWDLSQPGMPTFDLSVEDTGDFEDDDLEYLREFLAAMREEMF